MSTQSKYVTEIHVMVQRGVLPFDVGRHQFRLYHIRVVHDLYNFAFEVQLGWRFYTRQGNKGSSMH